MARHLDTSQSFFLRWPVLSLLLDACKNDVSHIISLSFFDDDDDVITKLCAVTIHDVESLPSGARLTASQWLYGVLRSNLGQAPFGVRKWFQWPLVHLLSWGKRRGSALFCNAYGREEAEKSKLHFTYVVHPAALTKTNSLFWSAMGSRNLVDLHTAWQVSILLVHYSSTMLTGETGWKHAIPLAFDPSFCIGTGSTGMTWISQCELVDAVLTNRETQRARGCRVYIIRSMLIAYSRCLTSFRSFVCSFLQHFDKGVHTSIHALRLSP